MLYTLLDDSKNGTVEIAFPYKYRSHDRLILQAVIAVEFKMQKEHTSLLFSLLKVGDLLARPSNEYNLV